jgi:hypothetical protein
VDRELLEVGELDPSPIRRIQVCPLRPRQSTLNDRVRDPQSVCGRPVAPLLVLREQSGENESPQLLAEPPVLLSAAGEVGLDDQQVQIAVGPGLAPRS